MAASVEGATPSPAQARASPTVLAVVAVDADTLKTAAIVAIAALVVLGLVVMKVVHSIVSRILALVVTIALAGALWTQRSSLDDCVEDVRAAADPSAVTCSFFGVAVDLPDLPTG